MTKTISKYNVYFLFYKGIAFLFGYREDFGKVVPPILELLVCSESF